jgi:NAD-dependent dihydropyrimidine dehydrogenase PreA subunit
MKRLTYIWVSVIQTLLRVLPFPSRTGMRRIGRPGRDSPVFLTCNFGLTVERVERALAGLDAYLLVANSRGVNVWCAATGGLLSNHDVVSVLKTSGIEERVDHRHVILPQLAATGIEGKAVREKAGWRIVWGPVEADDIPAFLDRGLETDQAMRTVGFPWRRRLEMAVTWAFPISLLSLLMLPFSVGAALSLAGLVWALSLLIFLSFPLYEGRLHGAGKNVGFVFFDFGQRGLPLLLWLGFMLALGGYTALNGDFSWMLALRWGLASLVVLLLIGLDLTGSTPVYKSGLHADRLLSIALDTERCKGAAFCEQVCPKRVFEVDHERRLASLARPRECVQCGACIVQCPFDALHFESPDGDVLPPEVVREFKLNLIGSRARQPAPAGPSGDGG